jgi:hypothetical protein
LVSLLSQRQDLRQEQIDRILNEVEKIWIPVDRASLDRVLVKIRDYFNNLQLPELNYENIKGEVQALFDDPKAGFEALRDRFSHFDRETPLEATSPKVPDTPVATNKGDLKHLFEELCRELLK